MIDFIKLYFRDKTMFEDFVCKEENFDRLYQTFENHSGEILYPYKAHFNNMDFVISKKTGYIKNSLHKFYNTIQSGEDQNYNDFTYLQLVESIRMLSKKMVSNEIAGITQLEFGLNINTPIPAEEIIQRNILMHNLRSWSHNKKYYGQGELKQFDHYNFVIKVYDKAKQYNLKNNVLRFEIKFLKRKEFQNAGIFNLNDLENKLNLRRLFQLLLKRFDELTIIDSIPETILIEDKDLQKLYKYRDPMFWIEVSQNMTRQTKLIYKRDFERILNQYHLLETKKTLRRLLIKKFIYLINN